MSICALWRNSSRVSVVLYCHVNKLACSGGQRHKYSLFKKKITLQDEETAQRIRNFLRLSFKQKLGVSIAAVVGLICFVVYEAVTLPGKLKVTTDAYENEREQIFIYPKHPIKLEYDDIFETGIKQRVKYNVEKKIYQLLPWLESKAQDPGLTLKLAESSNPIIRQVGLKSLTADNNWSDHQYRKVAQACSNRTMVSLARMPNADPRFFRRLVWQPPPTKSIEDEFRSLLADLAAEEIHDCIKQLTSRSLLEGPPKNIIESGPWVYEGTAQQYMKYSSNLAGKMEINFLNVLATHSMVGSQCEKIVENGGLQLLHRVYHDLHESVVVRRLIALTLANMALNPDLHRAIIEGGWVSVLHQWQDTTDTSLYFETARALANLDRDWSVGGQIPGVYEYGVYLAHPVKRPSDETPLTKYTDVIFIHGLLGGPFKTWRQEDRRQTEKGFKVTDDVRKNYTFFWPKDWLAKEVPHLRILNIGYETELTMWNPKCTVETDKKTLQQRGSVLIDKLKQAGVGHRPIIWVGHSMGGLLIKEILRQATDTAELSDLRDKTVGVMFYSTPHFGSSLARQSQHTRYMVFPSVEVQELREDNPYLKTLNDAFSLIVSNKDVQCLSFGESQKTSVAMFNLHVVPKASADPGLGEFHMIDSNHLNICKPRDQQAELYQLSLSFIRRCILKYKMKHAVQKLNVQQNTGTMKTTHH